MDSHDELKEIDFKNRTCWYFDDITKIEDFNLDNILTDEKSYENVLVYNVLCNALIISFDKVDGFIRVYDGTRYLVLFGSEKNDFIYNRIRYRLGVKSGITYVIFHNCAKIKVNSYDSLPLQKTMIILIIILVVILVNSVLIKDKNNYYYNILVEKASNEFPKK